MGQDLSRWGQRGQLDVGVELGLGSQTQQGNVVSEVEIQGEEFLKKISLAPVFSNCGFSFEVPQL